MEGKQDELFTGPTLQKIEDMMEYAYPVLQQFPKSEKFAMAADMKLVMDVMLEKAVEAQKKYFKKTTLQELDVANTKLQHYLRVAFRLRFVSMHKYEVWSKQLVEIGVGYFRRVVEVVFFAVIEDLLAECFYLFFRLFFREVFNWHGIHFPVSFLRTYFLLIIAFPKKDVNTR